MSLCVGCRPPAGNPGSELSAVRRIRGFQGRSARDGCLYRPNLFHFHTVFGKNNRLVL